MKNKTLLFFLFAALLCPFTIHAIPAGDDLANEDANAARLVREMKALDPAIVSVRDARTKEMALPRFKIKWSPAITLKKGTSLEAQKKIVVKVADYVVRFQGGVGTDGVLGGIIAFIEGDGWDPQIGQISYKVGSQVSVYADTRIANGDGSFSCCDDGEKIGTVRGDRFVR